MPLPSNLETFRSKSAISPIFVVHDRVPTAMPRRILAVRHSLSHFQKNDAVKVTYQSATLASGPQHNPRHLNSHR
jgi:hypothetical protein